jgi:hypothetical protein
MPGTPVAKRSFSLDDEEDFFDAISSPSVNAAAPIPPAVQLQTLPNASTPIKADNSPTLAPHSTPSRQPVHGESRVTAAADNIKRLGDSFFDAISSPKGAVLSPKGAVLSPKGAVLSPTAEQSPRLAFAGLNLFRVATADPTFNDDIWLIIFQMLVETDAIDVAGQVCKQWHALANSTLIWKDVTWRIDLGHEHGEQSELDGTVNWRNFCKLRHAHTTEAKPNDLLKAGGQLCFQANVYLLAFTPFACLACFLFLL